MTELAISARKISKRFRISRRGTARDLLIEKLPHMFRNIYRRHREDDLFWAVRDVSFDVKAGEVIGVIGRNGAGKSTLLKVLSRIIEPTEGMAEIYGRVSALLEVGSGFHMDLTGRENVYLNGAILGMRKKEIDRKFDEIADFAGVGSFLDTPVKYYSSGMYMRLAFAVAAHLQPDVLLIDEILAVGDMSFQKKCLVRMDDMAHRGKTVLIVSHNMSVVNSICNKAILMDAGRVIASGDKKAVIGQYLGMLHELTNMELKQRIDRRGNGRMRYARCWLESLDGRRVNLFRSGEGAVLCVEYNSAEERGRLREVSAAFALTDYLGNAITDLASRVSSEIWSEIPPSGVIRCAIPRLPLMPGAYRFHLYANVMGAVSDHVMDAGEFKVESGDFFRTGRLHDPECGSVLIDNAWSVSA